MARGCQTFPHYPDDRATQLSVEHTLDPTICLRVIHIIIFIFFLIFRVHLVILFEKPFRLLSTIFFFSFSKKSNGWFFEYDRGIRTQILERRSWLCSFGFRWWEVYSQSMTTFWRIIVMEAFRSSEIFFQIILPLKILIFFQLEVVSDRFTVTRTSYKKSLVVAVVMSWYFCTKRPWSFFSLILPKATVARLAREGLNVIKLRISDFNIKMNILRFYFILDFPIKFQFVEFNFLLSL